MCSVFSVLHRCWGLTRRRAGTSISSRSTVVSGAPHLYCGRHQHFCRLRFDFGAQRVVGSVYGVRWRGNGLVCRNRILRDGQYAVLARCRTSLESGVGAFRSLRKLRDVARMRLRSREASLKHQILCCWYRARHWTAGPAVNRPPPVTMSRPMTETLHTSVECVSRKSPPTP